MTSIFFVDDFTLLSNSRVGSESRAAEMRRGDVKLHMSAEEGVEDACAAVQSLLRHLSTPCCRAAQSGEAWRASLDSE